MTKFSKHFGHLNIRSFGFVSNIRIFGFWTLLNLFSFSLAWATPPTTLDLTYDPTAGVLHVEAKHVSDHLDKHYLRRLVIYRNGVKEQEMAYTRQKYPSKFVEDLPFVAKPGETIAVEVFCSQGGSKRAELTISSTSPAPDTTPPTLSPAEGSAPETPLSSPKSMY